MPPVSSLAIVPFRTGLVLVAGLSTLLPVGFLVLVALTDEIDRVVVLIAVGILGVGQALFGARELARVVKPALYCRDMRAIQLGDGWARWQYDETQWREATRIEARHSRQNSRKVTLVVLAVGVLVAFVGSLASRSGWMFLLIGLGFAAIAGYLHLAMLANDVTTRARTRKTGAVYITKLGIYRFPGGYTPLSNAGYQLRDVTLVDTTPATLRFEVERASFLVPRSTLAEVAVPAGHEEEARQAVDRFRSLLATRD